MKRYVCIDIGGTTIKYALADETGKLFARKELASAAKIDGGIARQTVKIVNECLRGEKIAGVAVATAGLVDEESGTVILADNFCNYSGTRLKDTIEKNCGVPATVANDCNCAALGEYWLGAAKNAKSLFFMTVGTGVGGAFVLNGEILQGAGFSAGEIGFMPLFGSGQKIEDIASTRAMLNFAASEKNIDPADVNGETFFAWVNDGDDTAIRALNRTTDALAYGIASVCCLLNPETILIGGGIASRRELITAPIRKKLAALLPKAMFEHTRIDCATLANDAGMIGALRNHLSKREKNF